MSLCRHADIHGKNIRPGHGTEDAGRGLFVQEIVCHNRGHFLTGLGHTFLHNAVIRTHGHEGFFLQMNIGASCNTGDFHQIVLQLSKTVKRFGDAVPAALAEFHRLLIRFFYGFFCFF